MLRPLLHYFLIGALLLGGKTVYERSQREAPRIRVHVSESASPEELDRAIREAVMLHEARRRGWDRRDPIVYSHLVRNMRFIEPDSTDDDATLYARAIEMNMQAHDPIVRARLLYRAREALGYIPEERMPTLADLEAHRRAHADRFEREGRVRFQQVFLSGSKGAESLSKDATGMRLALEALGDRPPQGLGDPLPGLRTEQSASPSRVRSQLGESLASALVDGVEGVWRGPIQSVYGLHFIRVLEREPDYVPELKIIAPEVRADLLREIREQLRQQRMAELLDEYEVERLP